MKTRASILTWVPLLEALIGAAVTGCGAVPAALDPGAGTRLLTTLSATGVQVYACRAEAGATPAWTFVAPDAALLDADRRRVGDHGAGPFWALADGSRIVGSVRARADAPADGAIPWLLLDARSTGTAGQLAAVSHVQRVHTAGGAPPSVRCDAERAGTLARVPYRADYRFFVPA